MIKPVYSQISCPRAWRRTQSFKGVVRLQESSLYDEFVNMSERRLPCDAKVRYLRLRQSGFVMKYVSDIDAYTHFVARKHIPKFQWLYESLFRQ